MTAVQQLCRVKYMVQQQQGSVWRGLVPLFLKISQI